MKLSALICILLSNMVLSHVAAQANADYKSSSPAGKVGEFLLGIIVNPRDNDYLHKLQKAKKVMKISSAPSEDISVQRPMSLDEAASFLFNNISMKYPTYWKCTEYDNIYFFSMYNPKIKDDANTFCQGYAIHKGIDNIYRWESLDDPILNLWDIQATKISTYEQAEQLTAEHYKQKMNLSAMDKELVINPQKITLLYDVSGFAKNEETIWEAKVITIERSLRALIWINPRTGQVRCLTGPWETPPARRTPEAAWRTIGEAGGHKLSRTKVLSIKGKLLDSIDPINKAMREIQGVIPINSERISPITIEDAASLLSRCVRIIDPPAYCFEHDNKYYFSDQSGMDEDFRSGYAIKRGEPAIYRWENGTIPVIPGPIIKTPVSHSEATQIARENYRAKMKMSDTNIQYDLRPSLVTLDYDIPDFAVRNEQIWEARFQTFKGELLAIIWINRSKQIRFLTGSWEEVSK